MHKISGFGVLPFSCSLRKFVNTLSQYSSEKLALCNGIFNLSHTSDASLKSISEVQISPGSDCQFCINNALTSYPASFNKKADTDESTPPERPTTTVFLLIFFVFMHIILYQLIV